MRERASLPTKNIWFSASSANKTQKPHSGAGRYFRLNLISAIEERHHRDIWGACREWPGARTVLPSTQIHLWRWTLDKHVLFHSSSQSSFSMIMLNMISFTKAQQKRHFQWCVHLPTWELNEIHMGTKLRPINFHFYMVEHFPVIIAEVKARNSNPSCFKIICTMFSEIHSAVQWSHVEEWWATG